MKRVLFYFMFLSLVFVYACGSNEAPDNENTEDTADLPESVLEGKGIGPVTSVDLADTIDQAMAVRGREIIQHECRNCHKNDNKVLIGPGFEGITNKRRPEWIMNMITNTDIMLELDPTAQKLLGEADRKRMPHQAVSTENAREVLEFFRLNDQQRTGSKDEGINN